MNLEENPKTNPPKNPIILVTGPHGSGRKTFVRSISEIEGVYEFGAEGDALGEAWSGQIALDGDTNAYFIPSHDNRRFDNLWSKLMAVVVLVDSAAPHTFSEAGDILTTVQAYVPIPIVFAANKQDAEGALSPNVIRLVLNIPSEIPVLPCVATDKESVKKVLLTLVYKVLEDIIQMDPPAS